MGLYYKTVGAVLQYSLSYFLRIIYYVIKQMVHIGLDRLMLLVGGGPEQFHILHHVAKLCHSDSLQHHKV